MSSEITNTNEIEYKRVGDYLLPIFTPPKELNWEAIGIYGNMRMNYLQTAQPEIYQILITNGTLYSHLEDINNQAIEKMETLLSKMEKAEPELTEKLKASNPMGWIGLMENIHSRARKIVLNALIYN